MHGAVLFNALKDAGVIGTLAAVAVHRLPLGVSSLHTAAMTGCFILAMLVYVAVAMWRFGHGAASLANELLPANAWSRPQDRSQRWKIQKDQPFGNRHRTERLVLAGYWSLVAWAGMVAVALAVAFAAYGVVDLAIRTLAR